MLMQPNKMNKLWNVALYVRLSQDDKDKNISNSILNQEQMLRKFVDKDPSLRIHEIYIDDGYTGTSFNRPEFIKVINDIKLGIINCIIVKDLSRFGREHITVDNYIENIFPKMGVRFISIMQNIDSYKNPKRMTSIEIPFLSLINEQYAIDISQKTKSALKAKQKAGKFVGVHVPYGYLRDADDKNKLVLDNDVALNVCKAFELYINGHSFMDIAKIFNHQKIISPFNYKVMKGLWKKPKNYSSINMLWSDRVVKNIINCPLYTGDMVQGITESYSHKVKKRIPIPKDKWIVVKNTHEAIISQEHFNKAQSIFKKNAKSKISKFNPSILAGYLVCADCGKPMVRTICSNNNIVYKKFVCSTSKKHGKEACPTHIISETQLIEAILCSIQLQIRYCLDLKEFANKLKDKDGINSTVAFLKRKYNQIEAKINVTKNAKEKLYPDFKSGILTDKEYYNMNNHFESRYNDLNIELKSVSEQISKASNTTKRYNYIIETFLKNRNIENLTRNLVVSLIENILVYKDKKVKIIFRYQDELKALTSILAKK